MKAITLWEPWASLVAEGAKKIETRGWPTKYRGPIAIHAAKTLPMTARGAACDVAIMSALSRRPPDACRNLNIATLIRYHHHQYNAGKVIAVADLVDCVRMVGTCKIHGEIIYCGLENGGVVQDSELAFGEYKAGRYAWILANVRRIEPVAATGRQGLWNWEDRQ